MNKIQKLGLLTSIILAIISIYGIALSQDLEFTPIRLAVIGDRAGGAVDHIYDEIILEIERLRPDLVVSVGDQIDEMSGNDSIMRAEWAEFKAIITPLTMPFYFCVGNHDIFSDLTEALYRELAAEPYYSFNHEKVHFVVIDNGRWSTPDELSPEQYHWLEGDLRQNSKAAYTLVFMHKPFWYQFRGKNKPDKLHDIFVRYRVDAVFTGHYHEYFTGEYDGIAYTGVGSSGAGIGDAASDLDYHYVWVTIDKNGLHIAPVKYQSVVPWDETTVAEKHVFDRTKNMGFYSNAPVMINNDFTAGDSHVSLVVDNSLFNYDINDTIVWSSTDGWSVEPTKLAVNIPAGQKRIFDFDIACDRFSWLCPSASLKFQYGPAKLLPAQANLWLARQIDCLPLDAEISIDGNLDESFWTGETLVMFSPTGDSNETDPTSFKFRYDDRNLYLGVKCLDQKIDALAANTTERDGPVFGEDCIGMFFEPQAGSGKVFQIYVNPKGAVYDKKYYRDEEGWMATAENWDGEYEIASQLGDNFWSLEIRIPLSQFEINSEADRNMNLNFRRKQKRLNTAADWQVPIDSDPHTMGKLVFK